MREGCANLARHIRNVRAFGIPVVVAVNRFTADTDEEFAAIEEAVAAEGSRAVPCSHWSEGGAGATALAEEVAALADGGTARFTPLYAADMPLWEKVRTIATRIYGADDIEADRRERQRFRALETDGYGHLPICMAKTQYSFSADPALRGAPGGHVVPIREIRLSAGAEFIVVICGDINTMPGLPRIPAAHAMRVNADGQIEGLS